MYKNKYVYVVVFKKLIIVFKVDWSNDILDNSVNLDLLCYVVKVDVCDLCNMFWSFGFWYLSVKIMLLYSKFLRVLCGFLFYF